MDARTSMRPGKRRAFLSGFVAGFRATCDWSEACKRGWEFRGGWLDGSKYRGAFTPHGAYCWLKDTGWYGQQWRDRVVS